MPEETTTPRERNQTHLRRLLEDALTLASGGLHANSACPLTTHDQREAMVDVCRSLTMAMRMLDHSPEFVVVDGSARMM